MSFRSYRVDIAGRLKRYVGMKMRRNAVYWGWASEEMSAEKAFKMLAAIR